MFAAALSAAFFLSGAAGLIFQVVWFYRAGLVFGNSIWAVTIVLSSFMGGLALGNALAGRYAAVVRRPLIAYAQLEAIVAVAGLGVTFLLPELTPLLRPLVHAAANRAGLVNLLRLVSAFCVLVVPATAMGATFPVLVGAMSARGHRFGAALGRLYGWNTLGAVVGVVAAELVLVDRVGVIGAAAVATLLNLAAAGLAIVVSHRSGERTPSPQSPLVERQSGRRERQTKTSAVPTDPAFRLRALLTSAFLSGMALLALEVVWFRFLTLYVLSTTLAASLMLAVVLAGIGIGGLVASLWAERASDAAPPALSLMAGATVIAAYAWFQSTTSGTQTGEATRILWFALVLTAPASFLSGMLFTVLGTATRRAVEPDTRAAAWLTMANTIGALCGAPFAGFVLMPLVGMERTVVLLTLVYAVIAVLLLVPGRLVAGLRRLPVAIATIVFALAMVQFPFGTTTASYFRRAAAPYADDGSEIVATREGRNETIFLMQQKWLNQPVYSRLVTNGFSMTGTAVPGMRYMRYFAYWPMLLHQGPIRHALLVCYGVGVTAGAVLDVPSLESLDVAEISSDIVAMSDVIYSSGRHPLRDPRVRLHIEDGRFFLATSEARFDLITGEPPPPRTPGAVNIYTREYFQLMYDRLAEGGMATYWLPVGRPQPGTDVDTILRAFCDVFADCSLWNATPFDLMMVGTRHATGPVADGQVRLAWQTPALQTRLSEVGFERPEQIGATFVGDAGFVKELVAKVPPLTDQFPHRLVPVAWRPSLSAPSSALDRAATERFQRVIDPTRARDAFLSSDLVRRLWPADLIARSAPFFEWQRMINRNFWEGGKPLAQIEDLHAVLTTTTLRTLPLWILGSDEVKERIAEQSGQHSSETEYARGLRALAGRDYDAAFEAFLQTEQLGLRAPTIRGLLVYSLCLADRVDEARQFARGIDVHNADEQHFWEWMAKTFRVSRE